MQSKILPFTKLTAITPLDGRYRAKIEELSFYTSEYSLIKTRIEVEVKYLIALSAIGITRKITSDEQKLLTDFYENFSFEDVQKVKDLEEQTRHDVKAMERTIRQKLQDTSLKDLIEFIHLGLTSEDINNISYRLMYKRGVHEVILPTIQTLIHELTEKADKYKDLPMLGRTHGQAAIPTTLGKELIIFAKRLNDQFKKIKVYKLTGKFSGAIGNFNALKLAYPEINWISFSENFISSFGLIPNLTTTQINVYDDIVEFSQIFQRVNSIIIDLNCDMWRYISDNWFVQDVRKGEVGSSTMPQKVNPIDFENSEGNLGMANGIIDFLVRKLAVSRLQRDLSDSTVIRNIGTVLGYCLVGYKSVSIGFSRARPNLEKISKDLNKDYSILSEGVQTILRKRGTSDPYSLLVALTKGEHINEKGWKAWIEKLDIEPEDKKVLEKLNPNSYIGLAVELTDKAISEIKKNE
ncbi:MAG: adenylosuccinate lyase [bacterium]|nr:adenylosuccinate lyase [bacterium]